jgi:hypothetical protein
MYVWMLVSMCKLCTCTSRTVFGQIRRDQVTHQLISPPYLCACGSLSLSHEGEKGGWKGRMDNSGARQLSKAQGEIPCGTVDHACM